ncbi:hypothetical protein LRP88_10963 [Fusarium phalaenopsidis]
MHPHEHNEFCKRCFFDVGSVNAQGGHDMASEWPVDKCHRHDSEDFDLLDSSYEAVNVLDGVNDLDVLEGLEDHIGMTISINGTPIKELAREVKCLLQFSQPMDSSRWASIHPLALGLYQLAIKTPSVARLVRQVALNKDLWRQQQLLKDVYTQSDEYMRAISPDTLAPFLESELDGLLGPSGLSETQPILALAQSEKHDSQSLQDIQSKAATGSTPSNVACGSYIATLPEDSGYGSIAERTFSSNPKTQEGAGETALIHDAAADDDAKTTYSKVTNEDPIQTRDFVHELASDIYEKLGPTINPEDWPLLSRTLPDLLKALAIKIGSNGNSQAHRDVMYFIHKEHQYLRSPVPVCQN